MAHQEEKVEDLEVECPHRRDICALLFVIFPVIAWSCFLIMGIEWTLISKIVILAGFFLYGLNSWLN